MTICSEVVLPEMAALAPSAPADLSISLERSADTARRRWLADARPGGPPGSERAQVLPRPGGDVILDVPGVAIFLVTDGRTIRVAPAPGADPAMVTLYTLGSAMGVALLQRGALVLHGAGLLIGGRAVLFLGPSGAGKSTLAARFAQAGIATLGDDTIALWPRPGGDGFAIYPAARAFKLWQDAVDLVGANDSGLTRVASGHEKFYYPNPNAPPDQAYPLGALYILGREDAGSRARLEPLGKLEAVQALGQNVYRPAFVEELGLSADHFRLLVACVQGAGVSLLHRPWGHGDDGGLVRLVLDERGGPE